MDLRQQKTLCAIRNAFLQLRAHKPLEKITVKELAQAAQISKATFYLHYRDIYDLSEQLQNETIAAIYHGIGHPEWVVTAPADFTRELFLAFHSQKTLIEILFSGVQESVLPRRIEEELRRHIETVMPQLKENMRFHILLTYEVQGGYHAYLKNSPIFGDHIAMEEIARLGDILSKEMPLFETNG